MIKELSLRMLLNKKTILVLLVILLLAFILFYPLPGSLNVGAYDFRPYWSASYLLSQSQDFSDLDLMDNVERTLTGWNQPYTMMAWFAPTGMVILQPYTWLPFERATYYWLLTNIFILSATVYLSWRDIRKKIWIPMLTVFGFSMTLLSLFVGQINILVLFGLIIYLSLKKSEHQYARGIGLALTTIKPHLVIFTLPLIILDCVFKKQWRILVGFFGTIFFIFIILFILFPGWISSFWNLVSSGMSSTRETPTFSGLLTYITGLTWGKWIWIAVLLLAIIIWFLSKEKWKQQSIVDISLIAGMVFSPIGWGYDQIMLLIPVLHLVRGLVQDDFSKIRSIIIVITLGTIYLITFIMRILTPNEVWFFWIPIVVGGLYCFILCRSNSYMQL